MNHYSMPAKSRTAPALWVAVLLILALCTGLFFCAGRQAEAATEREFSLLRQLSQLDAGRTVSGDEFDFFTKLLRKNTNVSDEASVQDYIRKINAEFYLSSQLGLCEPFDYETHRYRTEAENKDRAMKKLNGQVYYGPDSFSEATYFEYLHSCLRSDLLRWLVGHRDADMIAAAWDYYDSTPERFTRLLSITYEITQNGVTEQKELESSLFRSMGQLDPYLMDFLGLAQTGEETVLEDGRRVKKCSTDTELIDFDENEPFVVESWLTAQVIEPLLDTIAAQSQLVFQA